MKVLHLIPRLSCHGAGRQLVLLATALPRPPFEIQVAVLGDRSPLSTELDQAGVPVEHLSRRRLLDLSALRSLRRLVHRFRPEVVHVWGRDALRFLHLAMPACSYPIVVSDPLAGRTPPGLLDRWLLRRAARVIVGGESEVAACARLGIGEAKLVRIAPAAAVNPPPSFGDGIRALPPNSRCLACIGDLDTFVGFRDSLWAFDILRFLYPDLQVLLLADGHYRLKLEAFARQIGGSNAIHFLGERADPGTAIHRAEIVWVGDGSVGGALAAMAAGKPIVGWRSPALAEVVLENQTGLLVPPSRQADLARETRLLLDDAGRQKAWGEAGRQRALSHFAPTELVRRATLLYEELKQRDTSSPVS